MNQEVTRQDIVVALDAVLGSIYPGDPVGSVTELLSDGVLTQLADAVLLLVRRSGSPHGKEVCGTCGLTVEAHFDPAVLARRDEEHDPLDHAPVVQEERTFAWYGQRAAATMLPPPSQMPPLVFFALKLNGEAGEVAEKVGKLYRDQGGEVTEAFQLAVLKELGGVLWYVNALAIVLGRTLADVARINLEQLAGRKLRGTLRGSGDDR